MIAWIFAILSLFAMYTSFANLQRRYTPFHLKMAGFDSTLGGGF
jgi:hypothetical protein